VIAYFLELIAYRPLRGAPRLVPLITAIGASFFLQYVFRGFTDPAFKPIPWSGPGRSLERRSLRILKYQALVIVAAAS